MLVVDDEDEIRALCRVNLELEGFEVLEAGDGATAVDVAGREQPDLVFLDLMMPGMNGWEVLQQLKEGDATAAIPVVLLTARSSEDDQLRGWQEGIVDYVRKPFNPLVLREWAARALEPRDRAEEAARRAEVVDHLRRMRDLRQLR